MWPCRKHLNTLQVQNKRRGHRHRSHQLRRGIGQVRFYSLKPNYAFFQSDLRLYPLVGIEFTGCQVLKVQKVIFPCFKNVRFEQLSLAKLLIACLAPRGYSEMCNDHSGMQLVSARCQGERCCYTMLHNVAIHFYAKATEISFTREVLVTKFEQWCR